MTVDRNLQVSMSDFGVVKYKPNIIYQAEILAIEQYAQECLKSHY